MKTYFYLQRPKEKSSSIMISCSYDGKRLQTTTTLTIETKYWSQALKKCKPNFFNALEYNQILSDLDNTIHNRYYESVKQEDKLQNDDIKKIIQKKFYPVPIPKQADYPLLYHYNEFINERNQSMRFGEGIIKVYKSTNKRLEEYEKNKGVVLTLADMNQTFFNSFVDFLLLECNVTKNTVGKHIKTLKTFLHDALDKGLTKDNEFVKSFKVWKENADSVALTEAELERLEKLDLSQHLKHDKVRTLFLLQIYTGLRVSDLMRLKPGNFDFRTMEITINTQKTEDLLQIPIPKRLKAVLDKYPDLELPKMSDQKYNDYIKELCKMAEIDTLIPTKSRNGKEKLEIMIPKYELISSHTARRTYITISLKLGVPADMIMKITGHKDRVSFQKYVRFDLEESKKALRDVWG